MGDTYIYYASLMAVVCATCVVRTRLLPDPKSRTEGHSKLKKVGLTYSGFSGSGAAAPGMYLE